MIERDPAAAAAARHDLLIVGGGVYGIALAFEASRRGARPLLVERGDFGGETSWNSLRIVHGGLRYLQSLDLPRFRESVSERSWWLRHFPDQVRPLACLMPLYGGGMRRPPVLRLALAVNDLLSRGRNRGLRADRCLPPGEVLDRSRTLAAFPGVDARGLQGGALWHDAVMPDSQRLLVELLRWACAGGARALNYVRVHGLLAANRRVEGVRATDRVTGAELELRAPLVLNAAGPWCRGLAAGFDRDVAALFRTSVAVNALLDRPPPADCALALTPRRPHARTYFVHPWKGRLLAGTYHAPWTRGLDAGPPGDELLAAFLADLSAALPGPALRPAEVLRLHWGFLPARAEGSDALAVRDVLVDHGARGGPAGLFSVSGVKFTTARRVAERTVRRLGFPRAPVAAVPRPTPRELPGGDAFADRARRDPDGARRELERLVREEAALCVEDVLLRRTDWGADPRRADDLGERVAALLGWCGPRAEPNRAFA